MAAPFSTPGLTANLVLRVALAAVANAACLVPLRLLYRKGELAAAVFVGAVEALNLETMANALLWRDDRVAAWWPGYGLCDADAFVHNAATGLYATCLLATMRSLAQHVALARARPPSARDRRRRRLAQALVALPLPAVQVALTRPVAAQRFQVTTLAGCTWVPHRSWPNLVFFVVPHALVPLATAAYAVLAYVRFRRAADSALPRNAAAARRSQRTRRRLYMMVLAILVPFLPVAVALAVANLLNMPSLEPYSYGAVHRQPQWDTVSFNLSTAVSWGSLNVCYIPILTAVPVFLFFGTTDDAVDQYRAAALFLGLGRVFPRLRHAHDGDRGPAPDSSFGSSPTDVASRSTCSASKINSSTSSRQFDSLRSFSTGGSPVRASGLSSSAGDVEHGPGGPVPRPAPSFLARSRTGDVPEEAARCRSPFLFRTRLALPIPFRLPVWKPKARARGTEPEPVVSLEPLDSTGPWNGAAAAGVPHSHASAYTPSPARSTPQAGSKRWQRYPEWYDYGWRYPASYEVPCRPPC